MYRPWEQLQRLGEEPKHPRPVNRISFEFVLLLSLDYFSVLIENSCLFLPSCYLPRAFQSIPRLYWHQLVQIIKIICRSRAKQTYPFQWQLWLNYFLRNAFLLTKQFGVLQLYFEVVSFLINLKYFISFIQTGIAQNVANPYHIWRACFYLFPIF